MHIWGAVILVVVLNVAVISDSATGKIKNRLICTGLLVGLLYRIQAHGLSGFWDYAGGVLFMLLLTVPLFLFGAIGAGDAKLLAVVAGFLGTKAVPACFFLTFLLGALQAVLKMLWRKNLRKRLACLAGYVEKSLLERRLRPYGQALHEEEAVIHMSASILFASLIYMIGGIL